MAVSVVSFGQVADFFVSTTPKTVTGLSWSSGDVIVIIGGTENANCTLSTPTNANLTFSLQASSATGGSNETTFYVWTAVAGSAQSSQTVSVARNASVNSFGFGVWVLTGTSGSFANASANLTESTFTFTPTAGSGVLYGFFDWNADTANQTIATGTGTATERLDASDGSAYGQYMGDWMGVTASSTAFGVTSYTGLKTAHGVIEILSAAVPAADSPVVARKFPPVAPFTAPFFGPMATPHQKLGDASGQDSKALDDAGAGNDALAVAAAVPMADTAAGADSAIVTAAVPASDTATATDGSDLAVLAAMPMADTATGDDVLVVLIAATISPNQAVPALPGLLLSIRQSAGQVYGDASTPLNNQTITLTDTAAATDATVVAAAVPLADAAVGDDALAVAAAAPMSETGAGSDSLSVVNTPPSDAYQSTPAIAWMFASPRASSTQTVGDTTSPINMPDTASGTDALTLVIAVPLAETATGTDAASVAATASLIETATADDAAGLAVAVALSDTATADDSLSVQVLGGADAYQAMPQQKWGITRPGVAMDPPAMQLLGDASGSTLVSISDTATADDSLTISVAVVMTETAAGADALANSAAIPLAELVAAADSLALSTVLALAETVSATDDLFIAGQGIQGNVYPRPSSGVPGSGYPRTTAGIIGSVR